MKKRVMPYGFGKTFIRMELQELPKDIQEEIIERFEKRDGNLKVTKDTINIVIACEDIFANDKWIFRFKTIFGGENNGMSYMVQETSNRRRISSF